MLSYVRLRLTHHCGDLDIEMRAMPRVWQTHRRRRRRRKQTHRRRRRTCIEAANEPLLTTTRNGTWSRLNHNDQGHKHITLPSRCIGDWETPHTSSSTTHGSLCARSMSPICVPATRSTPRYWPSIFLRASHRRQTGGTTTYSCGPLELDLQCGDGRHTLCARAICDGGDEWHRMAAELQRMCKNGLAVFVNGISGDEADHAVDIFVSHLGGERRCVEYVPFSAVWEPDLPQIPTMQSFQPVSCGGDVLGCVLAKHDGPCSDETPFHR